MTKVVPFLKWPGGKRWIAEEIADELRPYLQKRYFEPFLGGGAVFFSLRPSRAVLSDTNADLINVYKEVKRSPQALIDGLKLMEVTAAEYQKVRASKPHAAHERALRFLYLNRTAFAGIFRLNRQGEFNVPFGGGARTPEILWRKELLAMASKVLKTAALSCADFEDTMQKANAGDVVYCDPTYTVAHDNNGFRRYNEAVFSWSDQLRLATSAAKASRRGALVIVSNAHHESLMELYRANDNCEVRAVQRTSCIAKQGLNRRLVSEALFVLRPK